MIPWWPRKELMWNLRHQDKEFSISNIVPSLILTSKCKVTCYYSHNTFSMYNKSLMCKLTVHLSHCSIRASLRVGFLKTIVPQAWPHRQFCFSGLPEKCKSWTQERNLARGWGYRQSERMIRDNGRIIRMHYVHYKIVNKNHTLIKKKIKTVRTLNNLDSHINYFQTLCFFRFKLKRKPLYLSSPLELDTIKNTVLHNRRKQMSAFSIRV